MKALKKFVSFQGSALSKLSWGGLRELICSLRDHIIADSSGSFELSFTVFRLGNQKFSTEKENFDLKENRKLKYSRFKLC